MNSTRNSLQVLLVVSEFPPIQRNVTRTVKFVKYLNEFSCVPTVLTINLKSIGSFDYSFEKEIPPHTKTYRAFFPNLLKKGDKRYQRYREEKKRLKEYPKGQISLSRFFLWNKILICRRIPGALSNFIRRNLLIPDERMPWIPFALCKGIRICLLNKISIIYSSVPCYSNHIVAWGLKKMLKLKWVADYRDPWTSAPYRQSYSRWRKKLETQLEKRIIKDMDFIVVVNEGMKTLLLKYHQCLNPGKIKVIPNGYDPEDFRQIASSLDNNRFTISHTGVIYSGYSFDDFLRAVGSLIKEYPSMRNELIIKFVGTIVEEEFEKIIRVIKELELSEIVKIDGEVPRKQALEVQKNSHLLVLHMSDDFTQAGALSSKVFDYLAAGRPILAMVLKGSLIASLIQRARCGLVVDPHDQREIKEALKYYYRKFKDGEVQFPQNLEYVSQFDRRTLTLQLYKIFESLSGD